MKCVGVAVDFCLERDDGASGTRGWGVQEGGSQSDGGHNTEDHQVGRGGVRGDVGGGGGDGVTLSEVKVIEDLQFC